MTLTNTLGALVLAVGLTGCGAAQQLPQQQSSSEQSTPQYTACVQDVQCAIDNVRDEHPFEIYLTSSMVNDNMTLDITVRYQVGPYQGRGVRVGVRRESVGIEFHQSFYDDLRARGMDDGQISFHEQFVRSMISDVEWSEGFCVFQYNNLVTLVEHWREGMNEQADWNQAECSGQYFGTE